MRSAARLPISRPRISSSGHLDGNRPLVWLAHCPDESGEKGGQNCPEMGDDLADVVNATAEHGAEGVADGAPEGTAGETAVGLHVADLGLDGAAPAQEPAQAGREAAAHAALTSTCVLCTRWPR